MVIIRASLNKPNTGKSNAEYTYFARHSYLELHNSFERLLKDLPVIFFIPAGVHFKLGMR